MASSTFESDFSRFYNYGSTSNELQSLWLNDDNNDDNSDVYKKSELNEKDCTIFVIDIMENMFDNINDNEYKTNSFNNCCQAISESLKRGIIKSADDLTGIILFNSKTCKNGMNLDNIYVYSQPDTYSAKLIKNVRDLPNNFDNIGSIGNKKECEFRDLLWCLQNIFSSVDAQGTKFGSKRAFIFTKNDKPYTKDFNQTKAKAQDMLDAGIEINVFPQTNEFKVKDFYAVYYIIYIHNILMYKHGI